MADVELFPEERYAVLKTSKGATTYYLEKDRSGHVFFEFRTTGGNLPKQLKGKFSSLQKGVRAFEAYERVMKQTQASKNEELDKQRKARRAKLHTETS